MKKTFLLFILFYCSFFYSQNIGTSNIFLQEFNYNSNECFKDQKGGIVFFSKYYSHVKLKTGIINIKDSITFKNLKDKEDSYIYYLKRTHEKDTINGIYIIKELRLLDKLDTFKLKKIVFKCLPKTLTSYECNDYIYTDVLYSKTFSSTGAILTMNTENEKIRLRLIKEDCSLAYSEEIYKKELKYSNDKNFLVLNDKNSFIFIFDRYLR
jgi:hypothetical protein